MAFITKTDYEAHINENVLDEITEVEDHKLIEAQNRAVQLMSGYLNNRYDVVNIFNKVGADRDPVVLGYAIDITLWYIHRLINPRKVPANRSDAYREAKEWLDGVCMLKINPMNLPKLSTDDKDYVRWGSNTKRNNNFL